MNTVKMENSYLIEATLSRISLFWIQAQDSIPPGWESIPGLPLKCLQTRLYALILEQFMEARDLVGLVPAR